MPSRPFLKNNGGITDAEIKSRYYFSKCLPGEEYNRFSGFRSL
jgi:hypothetical protein